MSKIKNCGLDQYGVEPFEQQQFATAGVEGVNVCLEVVEVDDEEQEEDEDEDADSDDYDVPKTPPRALYVHLYSP